MANVKIISAEKNWLEQNAIDQLHQVAALPGVTGAVGLPDLHPGKTPVGAAVITENILYPHLIGNDIGCGMGLFLTNLEKRKIKPDRLAKRAEACGELDQIPLPESYDSPLGEKLGTIGGGNHFAELQETTEVFLPTDFKNLGFDKSQITLLIHSGSRAYGEMVFNESIKLYQAQKGLPVNDEAAKNYLTKHDNAVKWAAINRELIAFRLLTLLGVDPDSKRLLDCPHNFITAKAIDNKLLYIHRKGAAPADQGALIIPGSRGTLTYLVKPSEDTSLSLYSLAHGAGRKWERSLCRARLETKYTKDTIQYTRLKSRVICHDAKLLFEEAPEAYKNIDTIIKILADYKLIEVIAAFKPILTYKA
jgi:release factor H-coupled RctB family protein